MNLLKLIKTIVLIAFAVCFLILMALKKMPLPGTEIFMSLQSLSISLLVIALGRRAVWAVLLYLALASDGLAVLAGGVADANWYYSPLAGYYIGFLLSSLVLAAILETFHPQLFPRIWFCFASNESVILASGFIWLSYNFGIEQAWWVGVYPYLFGAILKITAAAFLYKYSQATFKSSTILN